MNGISNTAQIQQVCNVLLLNEYSEHTPPGLVMYIAIHKYTYCSISGESRKVRGRDVSDLGDISIGKKDN